MHSLVASAGESEARNASELQIETSSVSVFCKNSMNLQSILVYCMKCCRYPYFRKKRSNYLPLKGQYLIKYKKVHIAHPRCSIGPNSF